MEVKPLGITQIDWSSYIDFFRVTGKSPTHNLDAHYMKPDNLGSFLASLREARDPRHVLRNDPFVTDHVFASFMILCSYDVLANASMWDLHTLFYEAKRDVILITSGSLSQWRKTIYFVCQPDSSYEIRIIMNKCLLYFERASLGEIFSNYKRDTIQDGTFILKER